MNGLHQDQTGYRGGSQKAWRPRRAFLRSDPTLPIERLEPHR